MTQDSQSFSIRTGRAQPRPLQTENFDEETIIRLKRAIMPTFPQMGSDAKALVDGFFTVDPELEFGHDWGKSYCLMTLLRGKARAHVSYDEKFPIKNIDSECIDWRIAIRQALEQFIGGENWTLAFDLCEFLLTKHRDLIRKQQHAWEKARATGNRQRREKPPPKSFLPSNTSQEIECLKKLQEYQHLQKDAICKTNAALKRAKVGYYLREQTGQFDSITSFASEAIDKTLALPVDSVRRQMTHAVAAFGPHSIGEQPDYGNAAHKAMHAAWAAMQICTGKNKFRDGVQKLQESKKLHPALAKGLGNLYGFTSQDGKGMRHPEFEGELPPDMATARFVVEICASFIAYMVEIHPDKFAPLKPESKSEGDGISEEIPF